MKQLLVIIISISMGLPVSAQSNALDEFMEQYRGERDVTHVSLSGSIFKLTNWLADLGSDHDEDLEAVGELSEGIESMEIMSFDDYRDYFDRDDIEDLIDDMKDEGYEVLMSVREHNQLLRVLSKQGGKNIMNDVTMINRDGRDFSIITMKGSIHMDDLNRVID